MTTAREIVRQAGVGASMIGGIEGISPHSDPWKEYASAKGLIQREQTEEMFWGTRLERIIAEVFSERMALPVEWCNQRIWSPTRPWQYATPDAFILDIHTALRAGVLECKTAGLHQAGMWDRDATDEDGVPEHYVAQVQWQMSVTGLKVAYIAVLIGGQDFRVYRIAFDPVLEEILVEDGEKFWREHLMANVEPPMGGSKLARDYLKQRYPRNREKLRPATFAEMALLQEYAAVRTQLEPFEKRRDELENELKKAVGEADGVTWGRNGHFTWKKSKDKIETNWEELAMSQLEGFTDDEKAAFIQPYTEVVPGSRRIHFREADLG